MVKINKKGTSPACEQSFAPTVTPPPPSITPTLTPTPPISETPTPTPPTTALCEDCVAQWDFDEGAGSTAADSSANGNHGTLINGPTWTAGRTGSALSFDGVDDYVNAGNNSSISNLTSFTWSAWIYPRSLGENNYGRIIGKNTNGGWEKALYLASNGILRFNFNNSAEVNTQASSTDNSIILNRWQHIAVTFNYNGDKKPHLYVNGVEVSYSAQGTMSGTPWNDSSYNLLVGNRVNTDRTFNGLIDEVMVYNRALNNSEIYSIATQ